TWMTAEEAVEYGFADDVIKRDADDDEQAKALAASWDLSKISKKPPKPEAKQKNVPKPEAPTLPLAEVEDDSECMCACAECKAGNCSACTMKDCEDANCDHADDGNDKDDPDSDEEQAKALREVESFREAIAILAI